MCTSYAMKATDAFCVSKKVSRQNPPFDNIWCRNDDSSTTGG